MFQVTLSIYLAAVSAGENSSQSSVDVAEFLKQAHLRTTSEEEFASITERLSKVAAVRPHEFVRQIVCFATDNPKLVDQGWGLVSILVSANISDEDLITALSAFLDSENRTNTIPPFSSSE